MSNLINHLEEKKDNKTQISDNWVQNLEIGLSRKSRHLSQKYKKIEKEIPLYDYGFSVKIEEIGKGATAYVQKYYDPNDNDYIALKILKLNEEQCNDYSALKILKLNEEKYLDLFEEENSLLLEIEELKDKAFLKYYGMFKEKAEGPLLLKMECGIASLRNIIDAGKRYKEDEALYILKILSSASAKLQENGIYNGDIKPENIIIVQEESQEDEFTYKISDYGIGGKTETSMISPSNCKGFSSPYAAEEVIKISENKFESKKYDPFKSDVYSLGITILELILGKMENRKIMKTS